VYFKDSITGYMLHKMYSNNFISMVKSVNISLPENITNQQRGDYKVAKTTPR